MTKEKPEDEKPEDKIKWDIKKEIFEGFVDEIMEYKTTDYHRGKLLAKLILKGEEYELN